jgi:predicted alpha/beta hydrolase family esterase
MNSTTVDEATHSITRAVVVHGYGATPRAHWFPWLSHTLTRNGVTVVNPELPCPEAPRTETWKQAVADALGQPDASTWVVAHSLGGITTLRVLAALDQPWQLGGLILVSGFTGRLTALPLLDDYLDTDVDAEQLSQHITTRHMIRSDDDPIVPPSASDKLARRLQADLHVISEAGHFLGDDGFTTLPALLPLLPPPAKCQTSTRG